MELGGRVTIDCEKTNHRAELEFKLKVRDIVAPIEWVSGLPLRSRQGLTTHTRSFMSQQCVHAPQGGLPREEASPHSLFSLVQLGFEARKPEFYIWPVHCQPAGYWPNSVLNVWQRRCGFWVGRYSYSCLQNTVRCTIHFEAREDMDLQCSSPVAIIYSYLADTTMNCTLSFTRLQDLALMVG